MLSFLWDNAHDGKIPHSRVKVLLVRRFLILRGFGIVFDPHLRVKYCHRPKAAGKVPVLIGKLLQDYGQESLP